MIREVLVRIEGLEPPCLTALDPKSSASTNFATSAAIFYWDAMLVILRLNNCFLFEKMDGIRGTDSFSSDLIFRVMYLYSHY